MLLLLTQRLLLLLLLPLHSTSEKSTKLSNNSERMTNG
jgi:hypothetical protein